MKTIEQISHKICDKYALTIDLSVPIADAIKEAQRWIPVEEEEPKNREKVLIKWSNDGKEIKSCGSLVIDSSLGKYWQSGGATQLNVTHWRPIELK